MIISQEILQQYESRYRAMLLNSLAGTKQAVLIGTRGENQGVNNLAIFNSLIHIGANPPLWAFIFRPDTVKRDTLQNILDTGVYTINHIAVEDYQKAHQTSAKYEEHRSEFEACGFSPAFLNDFEAPFVAESPIKIAMKFEQKIDIALNNTAMVIGSIQFIELDESLVGSDGYVGLEKANLLSCVGLDAYFKTERINRLSYAQTHSVPEIK